MPIHKPILQGAAHTPRGSCSITRLPVLLTFISATSFIYIMGKKQHSKDRLFITRTEWNNEWGGYKEKKTHKRQLPYYCCALTLQPFSHPYGTRDGYVFDLTLCPILSLSPSLPNTARWCKDFISRYLSHSVPPLSCLVSHLPLYIFDAVPFFPTSRSINHIQSRERSSR